MNSWLTSCALFTLFVAAGCLGESDAKPSLPDNAKAFDKWAIVWAGEEYEGYPLTKASVATSPAHYDPVDGSLIKPEFQWFSLAYGNCEVPPGAEACRVPITINVDPPCTDRPQIDEEVKDKKVKVRGVDATVYSGGRLLVETADFRVTISPELGSTAEETLDHSLALADALFGANEKGKHITKDSDFKVKPKDLCDNDKPKGEDASPTPSTTP